MRVKGHSQQKYDLATKNAKGHERIEPQSSTVAGARKSNQRLARRASESERASQRTRRARRRSKSALLLLIPPNSGRPDFSLPIHTKKIDRITELGGLVWLARMTGFFRTHHSGLRYASGAEMEFGGSTWSRQSQTAATGGAAARER